jgi:glycosyltransferase involved in cell wall biosynthesis
MKKVSVVTTVLCPSEKVFETIRKCFVSIRQAVDKVNGEWIVIDDGSLVGSEFFEKIADKYIKNEKVIGVSYSLNLGMKQANGDVVVKLDSDYLVPENLFEVLLNDWSDDLCFISPSYVIGNPNKKEEFFKDNLPKTEGGTLDKPCGTNKKYKYGWGGGILMFNKKVLEEVEYFDEGFGVGCGQDNDIIYRMLMKGYNWRWSNNVIAKHFASISSTDSNAPDSFSERRVIGKEYFKKKHGFDAGGFISKVSSHFGYKI